MRFIQKNGIAIVAGLVELLIGILLFVDPVGFTSGILMALGVILLICGVVCLIHCQYRPPWSRISPKDWS